MKCIFINTPDKQLMCSVCGKYSIDSSPRNCDGVKSLIKNGLAAHKKDCGCNQPKIDENGLPTE